MVTVPIFNAAGQQIGSFEEDRPPLVLSATAFMDHCYAQLGGSPNGIRRFGAIIKAARVSNIDEVSAAVERYDKAVTFQKSAATTFIDILLANAIAAITQTERDNIVNNWPT
jgi:hypothetical protein